MRGLKTGEPIPYDLLLLADEELQAIDRYIHQSDVYVVEMGNRIIGVCVLYPLDEMTIEIKAIAVDEAYQNQGIGKRMLSDAAVKAREKGCRELIIGTPITAQKQLAIYQKAGFEWLDVRKDFFITHYSAPLFEDGIQLKDMAVLRKRLRI
jgi:ribosomal protein S18 acetylase RimI-like enzyme